MTSGIQRFFSKPLNESDHKIQFYDTYEHPIQGFLWGDYIVNPSHKYAYQVTSLYGSQNNMRIGTTLTVEIKTENDQHDTQDIFFNRGVAGSQEYAKRFKNLAASEVEDRKAYNWLSRGLEEAILRFINQAKNSDYSLRAAV